MARSEEQILEVQSLARRRSRLREMTSVSATRKIHRDCIRELRELIGGGDEVVAANAFDLLRMFVENLQRENQKLMSQLNGGGPKNQGGFGPIAPDAKSIAQAAIRQWNGLLSRALRIGLVAGNQSKIAELSKRVKRDFNEEIENRLTPFQGYREAILNGAAAVDTTAKRQARRDELRRQFEATADESLLPEYAKAVSAALEQPATERDFGELCEQLNFSPSDVEADVKLVARIGQLKEQLSGDALGKATAKADVAHQKIEQWHAEQKGLSVEQYRQLPPAEQSVAYFDNTYDRLSAAWDREKLVVERLKKAASQLGELENRSIVTGETGRYQPAAPESYVGQPWPLSQPRTFEDDVRKEIEKLLKD